jgi:hypothetical protein
MLPKIRSIMKTTLVTSVLIIIFFSCSRHKDIIPKDCEELKVQGIIDSFAYPFRPGSAEWKKLTSHTDMVAAVTVPKNELQSMCTQGLVYTCIYCPLFIDLFACNHIYDCFLGLTENINSFGELIIRSDAGSELFDYYKTLFDTTKSSTKYIDTQFKIYGIETFFAQQEFLTKLNEQELKAVVIDAYNKLKYKQKNNVSSMSIKSSNYLLANILYHNLIYEPMINLIDRNNMDLFLYDQMWLVNQPIDSIEYLTNKYILEHSK